MEATYNLNAIVLHRAPFRENDSRVVLYSREHGKIDLVARGTLSIDSKLAGHLEPLNQVKIMAVRGKQFDYVGSVAANSARIATKNDLSKIMLAMDSAAWFNRVVKDREGNIRLYQILSMFLDELDKESRQAKFGLLSLNFIAKVLRESGSMPELSVCSNCHQKLSAKNLRFSQMKGGVICGECYAKEKIPSLTLSLNCYKLLRLVFTKDWREIGQVTATSETLNEAQNTLRSFASYYL